jgi:hypothetical protein
VCRARPLSTCCVCGARHLHGRSHRPLRTPQPRPPARGPAGVSEGPRGLLRPGGCAYTYIHTYVRMYVRTYIATRGSTSAYATASPPHSRACWRQRGTSWTSSTRWVCLHVRTLHTYVRTYIATRVRVHVLAQSLPVVPPTSPPLMHVRVLFACVSRWTRRRQQTPAACPICVVGGGPVHQPLR